MSTEVEAKLKVDSFDAVRAALGAANAQRVGRVRETNAMLERADDPLWRRDAALRVRGCAVLEGPHRPARLTFKGPAQASRYKSREEVEVTVDDAAQTVRILELAGFFVALLYEKVRETWRLEACTVELDELPTLGCFIEVEGPDENAVAAVLARLDLSAAQHVNTSYVRLLLEAGGQDRSTHPEFRFPS